MEKYNNGKITSIANIPEEEKLMALKEFAEGSEALEECLIILNKMGILTKSCCKGQHLSYAKKYDGITENAAEEYPRVRWESYILFEPNQDWEGYLSKDLIYDSDVIIADDYICYYGRDNEQFFRRLRNDLLTGKKNNQQLLDNKDNEITDDMYLRSYIFSLLRIGFTKEQIDVLGDIFAKYLKVNNEAESKELLSKLDETLKTYLIENDNLEFRKR